MKSAKTPEKLEVEGKRGARTAFKPKNKDGIASSADTLNGKQVRFIDEFTIDFNGTQAAIRAGYSKRTASEQSYDLLRKPQIQAAIKAKQAELAHKSGVTRERIIAEAARLAFSDVRQLFGEDGNLKQIADLDDATAAAVSSVELVVSGSGENLFTTKKIKLWDKNSALEKLLKHLGMGGSSEEDAVAKLMAEVALYGARLSPKN